MEEQEEEEKSREAGSRSAGETPKPKDDDVEKFISSHVHYNKNDDDVLDVHIGNPLHKIVKLLEDIKKQKAFSFTLKGSLGIAGVVLAFSFLGLLGAGNMLCAKGVQSEIGTIHKLNIMEPDPPAIPLWSDFVAWFNPRGQHEAVVLVREDNFVIHLPYKQGVSYRDYENLPVIATGSYDSCAKTLTVEDQNGVETFPAPN
jgi:hypothetical protein